MSIRFYRAAIAILTLSVAFVISPAPAPAQAIGGDCTAVRESGSGGTYRARASCASLNADSRARAKLVRNLGPDYTSSWFTALNVWRYTGWYTCYSGCSAAPEISHV